MEIILTYLMLKKRDNYCFAGFHNKLFVSLNNSHASPPRQTIMISSGLFIIYLHA